MTLWFDMPRDDWIAVAILIAVDVAPLIVMDDRVIDTTAFKQCIEGNARQMLHIAGVNVVLPCDFLLTAALMPVHFTLSSFV
jgi:hypothetical protein